MRGLEKNKREERKREKNWKNHFSNTILEMYIYIMKYIKGEASSRSFLLNLFCMLRVTVIEWFHYKYIFKFENDYMKGVSAGLVGGGGGGEIVESYVWIVFFFFFWIKLVLILTLKVFYSIPKICGSRSFSISISTKTRNDDSKFGKKKGRGTKKCK